MKLKPQAWAVVILLVAATTVQMVATAGTFPGTNGKIAFASGGYIRVINGDGTGATDLGAASAASTISEPAWNATGTKLVFRRGGSEIRSMNADGTNSKSLVGMPSFAGNPTWSADGSVVAFDGYIGGPQQESRIYTAPAAGGTATELVALDALDPTYSPDGTKIAYEDRADKSDIGVMNADGSGAANITTGGSGNAGDYDPSWSPDGTKIAFSRNYQIWSMNANGSGATQLTTQLTTGDRATHPTWSPDGTQIAFQRGEDIWVMDADGTDAVNITNSPDMEDRAPDWGSTGAPQPAEGIEFSADTYKGSEGGDRTALARTAGAVITVVRSDSTAGATMVFSTSDGSAKSSRFRECLRCTVPSADYLKASGTIVFGPGEATKTFLVPIVDDGAIEGDETVNLTLSRYKRGPLPGPRSTAVLTISDNDPNVSFERPSSSGSEAVGRPRLNLPLSAPATGATVNYSVTGGTATLGEDYALAAGTLQFGARSTTIPLTVVEDDLKEQPETVRVELSAPTNAELGPTTVHTFTITDNDPQGDVAGDTTASALVVDLVAQPRQVIRENLPASPQPPGDVDVYRVHLEAGDDLAIDVDPVATRVSLDLVFPGLKSSTLTILGADGTTGLAVVGGSEEPDGTGPTDNPAYLFNAETTGDYYLRLESEEILLNGYTIELHRLALAEGFQPPEILEEEGPMFAWLRGKTLGITGPTGYGFGLEGNWTKTTTFNRRSGTTSVVYTLAPQETVDFVTAFGKLRLQSLGPIVVNTGLNRWGDTFGQTAGPIPVRLGIPLDSLADSMRDEFGLELALSALENWTISMGSEIMEGGRGLPNGVEQLMPGVPYLWFYDEPAIAASLGEVRIEQTADTGKVLLILDPMDPFLYIRQDESGEVKKPTLAFSRGGRIPFNPTLLPTIPSAVGLTDFNSHVFTSAGFPPNPALAEYITIFADESLDLDANHDGDWLAGEGNAHQLLSGDLSAFGDVLQDINVGANARVIFHYNSDRDEFDFETPIGRATAVYNGQEEALWFRGRKGPEGSPLQGTPFNFLSLTQEDTFEGTINSDGEFTVIAGTGYTSPAADLRVELRMENEGIQADIRGDVVMKGSVGYKGATASCTARAGARGLLAFSYTNRLHMSGSLGLDGDVDCFLGNKRVLSANMNGLSGSIDDGKITFRLPYIGPKSITLF